MAQERKQQLLRGKDGSLHVGRVLKNGQLSKDAYHITDNEILGIIAEYVQNYCLRNQAPLEIMRKGKPFIRATLVIE